jgi:serine/threonine protein kinase
MATEVTTPPAGDQGATVLARPKRLHKYELLERVGQGGMGILYRAHDPDLDRVVAVKVLRGDFSVPDAEERFTREARALARLKHQNIVSIFDFGRADDQWFLVMEFIAGSTLAELIDRRTLPRLAERLRIFDQVCAATAHAHDQGWIHRDLKPSNVMLDDDKLVKVLDFGLARQIDVGLTQNAALIGSPNYMAPEQVRAGIVDRRADIFSASAMLYELLTYQKAFAGRTAEEAMGAVLRHTPPPPSSIDASVPPALDAIVQRGLAKAPEERFQDFRALREALSPIVAAMSAERIAPVEMLNRKPIDVMPRRESGHPVGPRERSAPKARFRRIVGAAAAACIAAGLAVVVDTQRPVSPPPSIPDLRLPSDGTWRRAVPDTVDDADFRRDALKPPAGQRDSGTAAAGSGQRPARSTNGPSSALPSPPRPGADIDNVTRTLARYASAYSARDAKGVAALMTDAPVDDLEQSFSRYASFLMTIEAITTTVDGDRATVVCREARRFENTNGERVDLPPETVTYELRRRDSAWLIVRSVH